MQTLIMAGQLILGLSILVIIHEFGHFMAARAFGMRVEKFYLFFDAWGVKLFQKKIGDTEYGIGWLPLGGYVKIAGMIDESMDKDAIKQEPKPDEYRSKPTWQRFIVIIAGVTMNTILGVILFSMHLYHFDKEFVPNVNVGDGIYAYEVGREVGLETGDVIKMIDHEPFERFKDAHALKIFFGATLTVERNGEMVDVEIPKTLFKTLTASERRAFIAADRYTPKVDSIMPNTAADSAGLRHNDVITMLNGESILYMGDLKETLGMHRGEAVSVTVSNEGVTRELSMKVSKEGYLGFFPFFPYKTERYSLAKSIKYGSTDAFETVIFNAKGIGKIFSGEMKASESLHGPIGIATFYGPVWNWSRFWFLTGMLSMVLAFVNILPIPALDGGHAVFLIYEMVTRRSPSDKFMERAQIAGTVMLIALMVYVIGNDVWKHILN